jgi:hypothetical protein
LQSGRAFDLGVADLAIGRVFAANTLIVLAADRVIHAIAFADGVARFSRPCAVFTGF